MAAQTQAFGRVAFREEGNNWNAYWAPCDTMEGAILLGSIKMRFVLDTRRKKTFMRLMKNCFADVMEEQVGARPTFPKKGHRLAPEHERTKE